MPVTKQHLVELVLADEALHKGATREQVEAIVTATIQGIGFHFTNSGEVGDPRPQPVAIFPQQNVHWSGGRRRRGGAR